MTLESCYRELDLPVGASAEEVRRAFRRHAKACHPDRDGGGRMAKRFQHVTAAYSVLKRVTPADLLGKLGLHVCHRCGAVDSKATSWQGRVCCRVCLLTVRSRILPCPASSRIRCLAALLGQVFAGGCIAMMFVGNEVAYALGGVAGELFSMAALSLNVLTADVIEN